METWLKAARDQAARLGEDIQKQAILLADDAGQKGKREVTFRAGPMGFELEGVHVAFVEPDGQAQQQGVCPGDKLISIAGYVIPENPKEESVKRWLDEMIRPGRLTFMTEAKSGASSLPPAVAFPKESDGGESLGEDGWQDSDFAVPADMLDDASSSRRSPDLEPSPEARLRAELYAAKDEARSLERELEDCRAECHELRHFAAEKADGSLAATRSEERLLRLNDQVALQRKESEELRKRNRELQAQLETLSSTCDELRRESAQNEDRAMEAMESRSQVLEEEAAAESLADTFGTFFELREKAELLSAIANDDVPQMLAVLRRADGNSLMSSVGSALHVATMYGSPGCTKQLLADQATIDCCDKDGHTPLHYAAVEGDAEVVQLLIDARADLFFPTRDARARLMGGGLSIDMAGGRTALHLAAENGNPEAAAALVGACGALAAVLDLDGATAWDVALREGAKNGGHVSKSRLAVAELLHPGKAPPSCEELRALAAHDAAQRKRRLDDLEAQQKQQAALRKEMRGLPADHGYQSPWPQLYTGLDLRQYLSPPLAAALALPTQARAKALQALCEQIAPEVFALRVFPEDEEGLTARLLEELTAIERWATQSAWELSRPNSMNRYGLVLRDVGLDFFLQTLQAQCVRPLASALWPEKN
ncbi:unnamed protein product, partial [Effrenium voratum]